MRAERLAAVSCHVERPLDDRVWRRFAALQDAAPGGFRITALMRPPDAAVGEPPGVWIERARHAARVAPVGHHTHFTSVEVSRPVGDESTGTAERVRSEAQWMRRAGLRPALYAGGGWYMNSDILDVVASLGYTDCTSTSFPLPHLAADAARVTVTSPARIVLPDGRHVLEIPHTHSLGMLARALLRRRALDEPLVHVHFHDWELLDARRLHALRASLALLARRFEPLTATDYVARLDAAPLPEVPLAEALSPGARLSTTFVV